MIRIRKLGLLLAASMLMLISCGGGSDTSADGSTPSATSAAALRRPQEGSTLLMKTSTKNTAGNTQQTTNNNHVRILYLIPQDRAFRQDWSNAIQGAAENFQSWEKDQLNGATFTLHTKQPEVYVLPRNSADYASDTWDKVVADVQAYAPVAAFSADTVWLLYVDVLHDANTPGRLGAALPGLAMFPRQDLEGLGGAPCVISDEGQQYCLPTIRWTGGLGHELGHAFGLPHPPGCEAGESTCDQNALMWLGYLLYPDTYLTEDEKTALLASPFFSQQLVADGEDTKGISKWIHRNLHVDEYFKEFHRHHHSADRFGGKQKR